MLGLKVICVGKKGPRQIHFEIPVMRSQWSWLDTFIKPFWKILVQHVHWRMLFRYDKYHWSVVRVILSKFCCFSNPPFYGKYNLCQCILARNTRTLAPKVNVLHNVDISITFQWLKKVSVGLRFTRCTKHDRVQRRKFFTRINTQGLDTIMKIKRKIYVPISWHTL